MSKTGDVRTYGLHQAEGPGGTANGHNVQTSMTTGHSSFFFSIQKRPDEEQGDTCRLFTAGSWGRYWGALLPDGRSR